MVFVFLTYFTEHNVLESIHVVAANGKIFHLRLNNIPVYVCLSIYPSKQTHAFFIHSSISGNLGRFHILAMINVLHGTGSADIFLILSLFSWDKYPEVKLLNYMVVLFIFWRNIHPVCPSGCTNLHSHKQCTKVLFPHILASTWYFIPFL